ncbi:MAG: hypothetical protein EP329_24590 [Deltaproteobacteria bacterium]|nr:MAG: hypothetical protein EP329_24590 [Deltaproteobacteria bacterium]
MNAFPLWSSAMSAVSRLAPAALLALATLWAAPGVRAENPEVNTQVFRPSPHPGDLFTVRTTDTAGGLVGGAQLLLSYGKNPLTFVDSTDHFDDYKVIEDQLSVDVLAGLRFGERFSVGVAVPVFLVNDGQDEGFLSFDTVPRGVALGDVRLSAKVSFLMREPDQDGFGLGLELMGGFPTASKDAFVGDGFTFTPALIADYKVGPVLLAANVGAHLRGNAYLPFNTTIGTELIWRFGVAVDAVPDALKLIGEVYGSSHNYAQANATYLEGLLGARIGIGDTGLGFTVGAGHAFTRGYGSVSYRIFGGLSWATPPMRDQDGDGILDDVDACPTVPEDLDGFEDEDGCPDADNDKDGIQDKDDKCPNEPEDFDGFEDMDGCPDTDNDKDGILDAADKCPNEPEDLDGFEDEDGCPDVDNDKDGILDAADKCPNEPEDKDNFEDEDGCPDPDNDNDGLLDVDDDCPNDPTNKCGVTINPCEIVITEKIFFEYDKDIIKPESFGIIDAVASVMLSRDWIEAIEVQGHTDSDGPDDYNLDLSQRRAEAVMRYMVDKGVDATRLTAKGYGETKPIASNGSKTGRAKNRRVQFIITKPSQEQCAEPATKAKPKRGGR